MNVLIFVMTLLMLLGLMTYSRLDMFRSSQVCRLFFKCYAEKDERGYYNSRAMPLYNSITVATKEGGKNSTKVQGSSRIGISLLIDEKARAANHTSWLQTEVLLKNLMHSLYSEQPFYQRAVEENPTLLDDMIKGITRAIDILPRDQKLKKAPDLANLHLQDPLLDQALYKMLQGAPYKDSDLKKQEEKALLPEGEESDEGLQQEASEHVSPNGYYSLLDFITAASMPKVRVYLASSEVLTAIFHDSHIVESIIKERYDLYKQLMAGGNAEELSSAFKVQYERAKDPQIISDSLDFTVTKTNPRNYKK